MSVNLTTLSMAQLVELYNLLEPEKVVTKFRDRPTGVDRLTKLLEATDMEVFEPEPGDFDVRVASSQVDPTEDTKPRHGGGRKSPLLGRVLKLVEKKNPKRAGTRTHQRYAHYTDCKTSSEYMDLCLSHGLGTRREILSDLAWDSTQGFIKLS